MVKKKVWGALGLTAAVVLGAAVCHADQIKSKAKAAPSNVRTAQFRSEEDKPPALPPPKPVAPPLELGSAKPCNTAPEFATPPVAANCGPRSHGFCDKLWDWLTYRPVTHTVVCGKVDRCTPPLFGYFLDYCPPAIPVPPVGHHVSMPVSKNVKEEISFRDTALSWMSFGMLGKSEKRSQKPSEEKVAEYRQVTHKETAGARNDVVEVKAEEPAFRLDGRECGKWRGLPARRN
jgi:hypothetical protein